MTKGEIIARYRELSSADQSTFDRWLKANLVIGSLFTGAIILMAFAGSNANLGPEKAVAEISKPLVAQTRGAPLSPFEMMSRLAPGELAIQQVDEPF